VIVQGLGVAAIIAAVWIGWRAIPSRHGELLRVNGGELYYTSSVTRAEAERLGEYLVRVGHFDGQRKRVQLTRDGKVYQVRYVVKSGAESDEGLVPVFQFAAIEIARDVLVGEPVEIHLCDQSLQTLRVVKPAG
jgi:hypothetical protein